MSFFKRRSPPPGLDAAAALEVEARALLEQERIDDALVAAERTLAIRRELHAPDDPALTDGLRTLGAALFLAGRTGEALALFVEAVRILEATEGPDPRLVGDVWMLAAVLRADGRMEEAWSAYARWVDLVRALHEGRHEMFASVVHDLWEYRYNGAAYNEAAAVLTDNLLVLETLLGEESSDFAMFVGQLAGTLEAAARYPEARTVAERHIDLCHRVHGERSAAFITSLGRLASVRRALREYADASAIAQRMAELCAETPDAGPQQLAAAAWERAENELQLGRHDAAEAGYRYAIDLLREETDLDPELPRMLEGLAELYQRTGHLRKAFDLLEEAYSLHAQLAGERSIDCAQVLSSLANLRRSAGDLAEAERVMDEALDIMRETVGDEHPAFARSLHDLGIVYQLAGQAEQARTAFERALAIKIATLGEDHPAVASDLESLGKLDRRAGHFAQADARLSRAVEILRATVHETNPKLLGAMLHLAAVRAALDRHEEAVQLLLATMAGENGMIGQLFSLSSEEQRIRVLSASPSLDALLSIVVRHFANHEPTVRATFDQVLRRKGMSAEALAAQRDALLSGRYPHLAGPLDELRRLRARIAETALAGPGAEGPETHARWLGEWAAEQEEREIELARAVPELKVEARLRAVDSAAVAAALPAGSVLIEFVQYDTGEADELKRVQHLLAFVLTAGPDATVRLVDIGAEDSIRRDFEAFRATITGSEPLRDFGRVKAPRTTDADAGPRLRSALFDPLLDAIGQCERLFLSPDGVLNRLPFEILPLDDGRRLIDAFTISYLSAGRDAIRFDAGAGTPSGSVVVADPDFDLAAASGSSDAHVATTSAPRSAGAQVAPPAGETLRASGVHFSRLPGTRVEGERIARLLGATPLFAADAVESAIKHVRSPLVLHIATHGFFLPDRPEERGAAEPAGRLAGGIENPMLRSGLALAGANTWLDGGLLPSAAEDALLNGEDVSALDLTSTELVVLSACDTGLGDVTAGEGVFGLRRAFVLAGARTLIMSLWKVPDQQTQELMAEFHDRILAGAPRAAALRAAQLAIKAVHPNPLYWGAFICQGEPGPVNAGSIHVV